MKKMFLYIVATIIGFFASTLPVKAETIKDIRQLERPEFHGNLYGKIKEYYETNHRDIDKNIFIEKEQLDELQMYLENKYKIRITYDNLISNYALNNLYEISKDDTYECMRSWVPLKIENLDRIYYQIYNIFLAAEFLPDWIFEEYYNKVGILEIALYDEVNNFYSRQLLGLFSHEGREQFFLYGNNYSIKNGIIHVNARRANYKTIIHEMMHMTLTLLDCYENNRFSMFADNYLNANPEGFKYGEMNGFFLEYFASFYGMNNFQEDVATLSEVVLESCLTGNRMPEGLMAKAKILVDYLCDDK